MAKCPNCHEEIEVLHVQARQYGDYHITIDEFGKLSYGFIQASPCDFTPPYSCPECGRCIAEDEETALKFLRQS